MSFLFDDVARILASPISRRRAFRLVLRTIASSTILVLKPLPTFAASCGGLPPRTQAATPDGADCNTSGLTPCGSNGKAQEYCCLAGAPCLDRANHLCCPTYWYVCHDKGDYCCAPAETCCQGKCCPAGCTCTHCTGGGDDICCPSGEKCVNGTCTNSGP
jgi:hypothetical protein